MMKIDDFEPEEHEPDNIYEFDITITFEEYQIESDSDGMLEARPIVVRTDLNEYHGVGVDEQAAVSELGWLVKPKLETLLERKIRE